MQAVHMLGKWEKEMPELMDDTSPGSDGETRVIFKARSLAARGRVSEAFPARQVPEDWRKAEKEAQELRELLEAELLEQQDGSGPSRLPGACLQAIRLVYRRESGTIERPRCPCSIHFVWPNLSGRISAHVDRVGLERETPLGAPCFSGTASSVPR